MEMNYQEAWYERYPVLKPAEDTIAEGFRLVPIGQPYVPSDGFRRSPARAADLAGMIRQIHHLIKIYNIKVMTLSYADRQRHALHERIDLLRSYSSTIMGLATLPVPRDGLIEKHDNRSLRTIAKYNRMSARERWRRFPPVNLEERREMAKECQRAPTINAPPGTTIDPKVKAFDAYLRRQAHATAKVTNILAASLLSDTNWKAEQKRAYDEMMSIELPDLGI